MKVSEGRRKFFISEFYTKCLIRALNIDTIRLNVNENQQRLANERTNLESQKREGVICKGQMHN
jgi:hypothetical protein